MKARQGRRSEVSFLILYSYDDMKLAFLVASKNDLTTAFFLQAFWPSLVMKKWLNIKPPVHDFSEDDYDDTETESEDDGILFMSFVQLV